MAGERGRTGRRTEPAQKGLKNGSKTRRAQGGQDIGWNLRERALAGVGLVEAGDMHAAADAVGRRASGAAVGVDGLAVSVADEWGQRVTRRRRSMLGKEHGLQRPAQRL